MLNNYRLRLSGKALYGFLLLLPLAIGISLIVPPGDFANYYYGSRFFLDGKDLRSLYSDIHAFNEYISQQGSSGHFCNYVPVPPFSAIFYVLFSLLDNVLLAKTIFNSLSTLFFGYSLMLLFRRYEWSGKNILILAICLAFPFYQNMVQGQAYLLVLAAGILVFLMHEERPVFAGFCLAMATALKIFPAVILLFLIWKKSKKAIVATFIWLAFILLVSVLALGTETILYYLEKILPRVLQGEVIDPFYVGHQGSMILFRDLFVQDAWNNPEVIWDKKEVAYFLQGALMAFVGMTLFLLRKTRDELLYFSMVLFGGFLVSSYVTAYSLILLCPLVIWSIQQQQYRLAVIMFLMLSVPVVVLKDLPFPFPYFRWILMLVSWILVIRMANIGYNRFQYVIVIVVVGSIYVLACPVKRLQYLQTKERNLLYYKMSYHENSLILYSCTGTSHKADTVKKVNNESIQRIERFHSSTANEDQLWKDNDEILLVNEQWLVFLSDEGQGVGFNKPQIRRTDD